MTKAPYTVEEIRKRVASAARDHDLLVSGWRPTPEQLASAPFLDNWRAALVDDQILFVGVCTGHPRLRDGLITTSPVIWADLDAGVIRTAGRFYRVGKAWEPAPPPEGGLPARIEDAGVATDFDDEDDDFPFKP